MLSWIIENEELKLVETPIPEKSDGYEIIKVSAIGINRADLLQLEGMYPSPDGSNSPGLEVSGTIMGTNNKVCALLPSGGYSEYVRVLKDHILPFPKGYSDLEAAALPEALITCYFNIFENAGLKPQHSIIIHGATSGIGSFAIKICKAYGATVYGSVGTTDKIELCKNLPADFIFNYHTEWPPVIKDKGGVDIIFDILGGGNFEKNISALKKNGRMISIAVMTGASAHINLASVLMKNLSIMGSTLRSQTAEKKAELTQSAVHHLYPLIESEKVKPVIDSEFPFADAPMALERLKSRNHFGKLVLKVD
jgi:putative PIG3 family NAD(P)H quinone oxidoreductase